MNKPQLLAGFAVKVLMGLLYGYVFMHYYQGDDTWKFFRASLSETQLLLNDPRLFFINEFTPANALQTGTHTAQVISIYLNDLQYVLVVKIMAVMNLVTKGNYYVNSILFNAVVFFGHYWLFMLMCRLFPSKERLYFLIIFCFLPAVFWLSGIRVDGWLFFFLSLFLNNMAGKHINSVGRWLLVVTGFAGVIICRPQVAVCTALVALAYFCHVRFGKPLLMYGAVCLLAMIAFFVPSNKPAHIVAQKQNEFLHLKGTKFKLDKLDDSPASYLNVFPQAAGNTFLRPFPWEAKGFLQLMASAEVIVFWMIIIAGIVQRHEYWKIRLYQPVVLMLLILGISTFIITGYIVPFPGAIVRYKAIAEILILCGVASLSKWNENLDYNKI
ncbi:MAG TPA: hypothetical protein VM101_10695 [Flavitalea sp.]|nr:hypothetical protein [Flavitalea sp.]